MEALINFNETNDYLTSRNVSNVKITEEKNPSPERLQFMKEMIARKAVLAEVARTAYQKIVK